MIADQVLNELLALEGQEQVEPASRGRITGLLTQRLGDPCAAAEAVHGSMRAAAELDGGRVLQFFSQSKDADDLYIGVPHWRKLLSNFHPVPEGFLLEGRRYPTVEHAFQAAKYLQSGAPGLAERFECAGAIGADPKAAKKAGARKGFERAGLILDRDQWGQTADGVMEAALRARWGADREFRTVLEAVRRQGVVLLHFERSGAKSYWGGSISRQTGEAQGRNQLGEMLMTLAAEVASWEAAGANAEEPS